MRLLGRRQQRDLSDRPSQPATRYTFLKGFVAGSVNLVLRLIITGAGNVNFWSVCRRYGRRRARLWASITLWVRGAHQLGAARRRVIFATAPFLSAVISWIVLSDTVHATQVVAMALAAAGVALSLRSSHVHDHRHTVMTHTHEHDHQDGHHNHVHADGFAGRHSHMHEHSELVHSHPHVPDLHHRHDHS